MIGILAEPAAAVPAHAAPRLVVHLVPARGQPRPLRREERVEGDGAGEGGQPGGDQEQVPGAHQAVPPGQGSGHRRGEGGGTREVCADPAGVREAQPPQEESG